MDSLWHPKERHIIQLFDGDKEGDVKSDAVDGSSVVSEECDVVVDSKRCVTKQKQKQKCTVHGTRNPRGIKNIGTNKLLCL